MENNESYYNRVIYSALRIGFITLILVWSFEIIKPFILPILWGIIISVAIYPLFKRLSKLLGNRDKLASIIITTIALSFLVIPSIFFVDSTIDGVQYIANQMGDGSINIPTAPKTVSSWPIIGKPLFDVWHMASTNLEALIIKFAPQLKEIAPGLLSIASSLGTTILLFIISIIIAGALLTKADKSEKAAKAIFKTLIGKQGESFVELSASIIRSVVQGVLGVAAIQSLAGALGIFAIGIPIPGLWALLILFVAIMQLPVLLIMGPLAIYVFTITDTTYAIMFLIWSIIVSAADAFLKPIFLGRGIDIPMLAILLGAIGGMLMSGIIGLFVGAVVLALTYKIFQSLFIDNALDINDEKTE